MTSPAILQRRRQGLTRRQRKAATAAELRAADRGHIRSNRAALYKFGGPTEVTRLYREFIRSQHGNQLPSLGPSPIIVIHVPQESEQ